MPERQRGKRFWKASKSFDNAIEVSNREVGGCVAGKMYCSKPVEGRRTYGERLWPEHPIDSQRGSQQELSTDTRSDKTKDGNYTR